MDPEYALTPNELESLMKRLRVPRDEIPTELEGTGTWLLHKWRQTGKFCCIGIHSDYDFVWDIWSAYHESSSIDSDHLEHRFGWSLQYFDDAVYVAAAAALGVKPAEMIVRKKKFNYSDVAQASVEAIRKNASEFFEKIEREFGE